MALHSSPSSSAASSSAGLNPGASGSGGAPAAEGPAISHFKLDNGMEVVVIPDHRAPVVTHMVWYRNGSADDPAGKSGIAHFLEHLMFKGTESHPKGQFSELVAELGGQENAFTSNDYTAYFQRVPKEHLSVVMDYEADRMSNLVLTDDVVAPERDVVLEERRMRTDSDPSAQLHEAVQAALYTHHPYGKPIIGWHHEIEDLGREDALAYYNRFYTPENAILIVAGDVDEATVHELAARIYGPIKARGQAPVRRRPREPEPRAHRRVTLADEKVEQPSHQCVYLVPSYRTADKGEAEALEVLAHLLGGGQTSILYRKLVVEQKIAVVAECYYMGTALDETRFWFYAMPAPDVTLEQLDDALEAIIADVARNGVEEADLARAKTRLVADAIYAQDNQTSLARWYGAALTTGMSVADVAEWPDRMDGVTAEDVRKAAAKWLDRRRAVTGFLLPKDEPAKDEPAQAA
ncbi:MAG: peptidase domain protein [Hyphomicrobiales bacterium]|nr:peptidase domain protein [Hyphomicrobiales bacterium]